MKKISKRFVIVGTIVVIVGIAIIIVGYNCLFAPYDDTINGEFNVNQERYQNIISNNGFSGETLSDTFSGLNEYIGFIGDAATARKEAEKVWVIVFGRETLKNEKPYQVYFDPANEVWLVKGTLPDGYVGGTAHILLEKATGKILAVWHEL